MKHKSSIGQKFFFILLFVVIFGAFFFLNIKKTTEEPTETLEKIVTTTPVVVESTEPKTEQVIAEPIKATTTTEKIYIASVPFMVQAPFGEWKDPRQQDACEEMTAFLAVSWAKGEVVISKKEAKEKILDIVKYEEDQFGESRDTSAADTIERIYFGYFNYPKVRLEENITSEMIIQELINGNLVVVPANGQLLKNIHFTQPGPERHMIIIRGFDFVKKEFITNDVGIGVGENYRYPADVLFNAIADYPSGYHVPREGMPKVMIVVEK